MNISLDSRQQGVQGK